jgi:methionyl-tRNA formyltransferase
LKITLLNDNPQSWILPYIERLKNELTRYQVNHIYDLKDIKKGDIMFILSCENIISQKYLKFHKNNIVVHPSKIPLGKGWSPIAWQLLEGKNEIPVSLFDASDKVDAGDVYLVKSIKLEGHELNDEIKHKQGLITIDMIKYYLNNYDQMMGISQTGEETFYHRRTPKHSELDINKSLKEQFNLLRVVDNERYPAYFYFDNKKYILKVYKED